MYYIVETEWLRDGLIFRRYDNACAAALELARGTPNEVRVVRVATLNGHGRQVMCVYNCPYEVSAAPLPLLRPLWDDDDEEEGVSKRRYRRRRKK